MLEKKNLVVRLIFINKVLLEHSFSFVLIVVYGCFGPI